MTLTADSLLQQFGNGRYARELLGALLAKPEVNIEWHLAAYCGRALTAVSDHLHQQNLILPSVVTLPPKKLARLASILLALRVPCYPALKPGILHALRPTETMSLGRKVKQLVTLHDLANLGYLEGQTQHSRILDVLVLKRVVQKADLVATDCDSVRNEAVTALGVPISRLITIYPGISDRFHQTVSEVEFDRVRFKYRLPSRYLMTLGQVGPRKNIERLLAAYSLLASRQNGILPLCLVGSQLDAATLELHISDVTAGRIRCTGYVPEGDLLPLLAGATAFIFPSLYEGFGFPALEAQALGAPALVSDIPTFHELLGDSVIYFNPRDIESMVDAIERVLNDSDLQTKLSNLGKMNARRYRWRDTADAYINAYKSLA